MSQADWNNLGIDEYINAEGLDLIRRWEGFSPTVYRDPVGVPTIGYGSTWDGEGKRITMDQPPIDEATATEWLMREVREAAEHVHRLVTVRLTSNQNAALVSFIYNLGVGNFGRSTMLKYLNEGEYQKAADEFPKWRLAGGRVLEGLVRRREAERALFLKA